MAWLAVDKKGKESILSDKPERFNNWWAKQRDKYSLCVGEEVMLPKGTIKKIIGRELTWQDEPVEIK